MFCCLHGPSFQGGDALLGFNFGDVSSVIVVVNLLQDPIVLVRMEPCCATGCAWTPLIAPPEPEKIEIGQEIKAIFLLFVTIPI